MVRRFFTACVLAGIASLAVPSASRADSLLYQVDGAHSSVSGNSGTDGLQVDTALSLFVDLNSSFTLGDGDSRTFNFFRIWSPETSIQPDDLAGKDITATLAFSEPPADATFGGTTVGTEVSIRLRGRILTVGTGGTLTWDTDNPVTIDAGDREFTVLLSDTTFNSLAGVYVGGELLAGTVTATVTQTSSGTPTPSPAAVPLPVSASGGVMLMSLLGIAKCVRTRHMNRAMA